MTRSLIALLVLAAGLAAQPQISCDQPLWQLGTVPQKQKYEHKFPIRNDGNATLEILNVIPSCQCAAGIPEKRRLEPGESTEIKATLETLTFKGPLIKTIQVVTNDPKTRNFMLTIKADVVPPLAIRPAELDLGELAKSATSEPTEFRVLVSSGVELTITGVQTTSELFTVEAVGEPEDLGGGARSHRYRLTKKPGGQVGILREKVIVQTNLEGHQHVDLGVKVNVLGEVKVSPKSFNLGRVKQGESTERIIDVTKVGTPNLEVVGATASPSEVFVAEVIPVEAGRSYQVKVKLAEGAKPGYHRGTVTVRTNCEGEETLTGYFYVFVNG